MLDLSIAQRRVYDALKRLTDDRGIPPTTAELAEELQLAYSTVYQHMLSLVELGAVHWPPGARTLTIRRWQEDDDDKMLRLLRGWHVSLTLKDAALQSLRRETALFLGLPLERNSIS